MSEYRTDHVEPVPLFYQPGYLTISDYDNEFRLYTLKFPNDEVKYGFYNSLIPITLGKNDADHPASMRSMILDLRKGDMNSFLTR